MRVASQPSADAFPLSGAVLAGGRSERMGAPKALLVGRGGEPLLVEALRALHSAGAAHLLVGCRDAAQAATLAAPLRRAAASRPRRVLPPVRRVLDLRAGQGPLAGLEALLAACPTEWLLVVACDMPSLGLGPLTEIATRAARSEKAAVIPLVDGQLQPLHAAYSKRSLPAIRAALDAGNLRLMALADVLDAERLETSADRSYRNVNTLVELREAGLEPPPDNEGGPSS